MEFINPEHINLELLKVALEDNSWEYDADVRVLRYDYYEVDLERMRTSAEVLDWIVQVSHKGAWGTPKVVGDLVRLVDAILGLQQNYCGRAMDSEPSGDVAELIAKRFPAGAVRE